MRGIGKGRHSLVAIIGRDLLLNAKFPLFLIIVVQISAVMVVITAYKTRLLMTQKEQLVFEREALDIEWRNLILEENVLGDRNRVERIAVEKLKMHHVDLKQENIVVQK